MLLTAALATFKGLELKMSEVYLWCSINYDDLELRQFFSDMSDQELAHARRLDDIARSCDAATIQIDIPAALADTEAGKIDAMIEFVKTKPGLDDVFLRIADMEAQELNLVFESICRANVIGVKMVDSACINTGFHINLLKKAVEKFPLRDDTKRKINSLQVRDKNYYKVFSD